LKQFCFRLGLASVLACSLGAADRVTVVHADLKSGKLVRSVVVASKPVTPKVVAPVEVGAQAPAATVADRPDLGLGINAVVESIAAQHSLPPQLIHSVIQVESNYNPNAVSPKGALGLMQLIPSTARRFGVLDAFDPVENIQGGAKYLKYLLDLYNNDYRLALAAYNAGEAAVAKYGDVPPFAETRNYVV
jgi:soluble lytic murein transglycosylase-like protein